MLTVSQAAAIVGLGSLPPLDKFQHCHLLGFVASAGTAQTGRRLGSVLLQRSSPEADFRTPSPPSTGG